MRFVDTTFATDRFVEWNPQSIRACIRVYMTSAVGRCICDTRHDGDDTWTRTCDTRCATVHHVHVGICAVLFCLLLTAMTLLRTLALNLTIQCDSRRRLNCPRSSSNGFNTRAQTRTCLLSKPHFGHCLLHQPLPSLWATAAGPQPLPIVTFLHSGTTRPVRRRRLHWRVLCPPALQRLVQRESLGGRFMGTRWSVFRAPGHRSRSTLRLFFNGPRTKCGI